MKRKFQLVFALLFTFQIAFAQQKMVPETLWKLGRVSDPQVSPLGDKVLYSVRNYDLKANKGNSDIWMYDFIVGGSHPVCSDSSNETSAKWSSDGSMIYFLNDVGGSNQLWSIKADGSEKQKQTSFDNDINMYGVAPSGDKIWLAMDVKIDQFLGKEIYPDLPKATGHVYNDLMMRHWDTWADGSYSHIFVSGFDKGKLVGKPVDIMKDESYDSPMKPDGGEEEISWRPDGKMLAYTCKKFKGLDYAVNTNSDIYLYDLETKKTTDLTAGNSGYDRAPSFSPDGNRISWICQQQGGNEADRRRIFMYHFDTKANHELTTGFDFDVESEVWSADGNRIFFIADVEGTEQIYQYDFYKSTTSPIRQVTKDIANYTSLSVTRSKNKQDVIIATRESMSAPSDLFYVDPKINLSKQITFTNKEVLSQIRMGDVTKRTVKATDGKDILTWVIYPPDFDPTKKYPTLLYCQGCPHCMVGQFFSYRWNFQLMAANGYIVVAPNRRGLPGFGSEWNNEISGDWGGQAMKDLLSAIDDVSRESYVDKTKLGAVGASFGGFSVFWLEGNHEKRFKAFIAHCGVFNFESMMATEELFFHNWEFGGPYWLQPEPKSYSAFSPNRFVRNWDTPILIISNEKDYRVPYTQGLEAYTAARMKNIPARYLSFPDENHWVLKPQNSILWQREFFDWLDKYLK